MNNAKNNIWDDVNLLRLVLIIPNINNKLTLTINGIKLAFISLLLHYHLLYWIRKETRWISGSAVVQHFSWWDLNGIIKFNDWSGTKISWVHRSLFHLINTNMKISRSIDNSAKHSKIELSRYTRMTSVTGWASCTYCISSIKHWVLNKCCSQNKRSLRNQIKISAVLKAKSPTFHRSKKKFFQNRTFSIMDVKFNH